MEVEYALNIALIILTFVNIICHSIGLYLLKHVKKNGSENVQHIYIKNLSITELLLNIVVLADRVSHLIPRSTGISYTIREFRYYCLIFMFTGMVLVYYLIMYYIMLDKMVEIHLNIKYHIYWSESKAKLLVKATCLLGVLTSFSFSLAYGIRKYQFEVIFIIIVYPVLNFVFVILASVMYAFIFYKFKQSRIQPTSRVRSRQRKPRNERR